MKPLNFFISLILLYLFGCSTVPDNISLPLEHPANRLARQAPLALNAEILTAEPVKVPPTESAHEHHH